MNINKMVIYLGLFTSLISLNSKNALALISQSELSRIKRTLCVAKITYGRNKCVQHAICLGEQLVQDIERESVLLHKLEKAVPEIKELVRNFNLNKLSLKDGFTIAQQLDQLWKKYKISACDIDHIPKLLDNTVEKLSSILEHLDRALVEAPSRNSWFGSYPIEAIETFHTQIRPKFQELKGYQTLINKLQTAKEKLERKFSFFMPKNSSATKNVRSKKSRTKKSTIKCKAKRLVRRKKKSIKRRKRTVRKVVRKNKSKNR